MTRHIRRFCDPLTIEGSGNLDGLRGPIIVMPNHSSHMDTPVALSMLPERIRANTYVGAAADKFYRPGKRTWWFSLFYGTFPIHRGAGSATLEYASNLLDAGKSVLLFPEGTRSVDGAMARFHHGVSLLAIKHSVPVLPIYMEGLRNVMPKGQREPRPASVRVRIGAAVSLTAAPSVPAGTSMLEEAMCAVAGLPLAEAVAA
jgi:1-acyl-sn-glycerol-3-phosphate acyltransferase